MEWVEQPFLVYSNQVTAFAYDFFPPLFSDGIVNKVGHNYAFSQSMWDTIFPNHNKGNIVEGVVTPSLIYPLLYVY